jgi:hypothetical protein
MKSIMTVREQRDIFFTELTAARAEIAKIKSDLAKRDAEIAELKQNGLIIYGRKIDTLNKTIRLLNAKIAEITNRNRPV